MSARLEGTSDLTPVTADALLAVATGSAKEPDLDALAAQVSQKVFEVLCRGLRNLVHNEVPLMLAYHFNVGFPLLDDGSELLSSAREIEPITDDREAALTAPGYYGPARKDCKAIVLVHRMPPLRIPHSACRC